MLAHWKKSYDQPRQCIKKQRHHFADKGPSNQNYGFSSSHVWMWELDYKESWALMSWCFWTVVLEKTLESPLDSKEIKPVIPKRNQPQLLIGRIVLLLSFNHSVISDSFQTHVLQHARHPCPSLSPRVCSNSCPLSWWGHPISSSSFIPFSSCLNLSQHQGVFQSLPKKLHIFSFVLLWKF